MVSTGSESLIRSHSINPAMTKKERRLINARESGKEEIELKNDLLFELVLY